MARKKNPFGKKVDIDNPYAIYKGYFSDLGETEYRILKTYQHPDNERKNSFARWLVAGKSDATHGSWEYGDMYADEVQRFFHLTYATKEWKEFYS